jgi:hypothetical protein
VDEEAKKRRSMELLEDNLGATAVEITKEDRERLDEGAPSGRTTVACYEAETSVRTGFAGKKGPPHHWERTQRVSRIEALLDGSRDELTKGIWVCR